MVNLNPTESYPDCKPNQDRVAALFGELSIYKLKLYGCDCSSWKYHENMRTGSGKSWITGRIQSQRTLKENDMMCLPGRFNREKYWQERAPYDALVEMLNHSPDGYRERWCTKILDACRAKRTCCLWSWRLQPCSCNLSISQVRYCVEKPYTCESRQYNKVEYSLGKGRQARLL